MGKIVKSTDKNGQVTYPVTLDEAVVVTLGESKKTLKQHLANPNSTPIMSALYTGLYYGANSTNNGYFEPICVKPKNTSNVIGKYYIRFRMTTTSTGYASYWNSSDVEIWFNRTGSVNCYRIWNWRVGSNLHNTVGINYPSTNAYFNTSGTHIGVGITADNNYNQASYKRDTLIEILEISEDLIVTLDLPADTKQYTKMPWYNSTALPKHTTLNAKDVGLQETGDSNTYDRTYINGASFRVGSKYRINGNSLAAFTSDDKVVPISVCGTTYTTTAYTIANGTRVYNTDTGIDWKKGIIYFATSTNTAVGGLTPTNTAYFSVPAVDMRYSDNVLANNNANNTLGFEEAKPVYLRGVIKEDGLFYIRPATFKYSNNDYYRAFVQDIPLTEEKDNDGYKIVYWLYGYTYYNSSYATRGYQATLAYNNPMFVVVDGNLINYEASLEKKVSDLQQQLQQFNSVVSAAIASLDERVRLLM